MSGAPQGFAASGGVAGLASSRVPYFLAASARASCSMRSIQPRRAYILCLGLGIGIALGLPFAACAAAQVRNWRTGCWTRFDCFLEGGGSWKRPSCGLRLWKGVVGRVHKS